MVPMNSEKMKSLKNVRSAEGHGELILAVEDEELLRDLLRAVLGESGYRVMLAADGTEAVEKYMEHLNEIGVVLLDMGLPKMSGEEVLSKLIASNPGVKVIAVSALTRPEVRSAVEQLGACDYMSKPYLSEDLLPKVQDVLRRGDRAGNGSKVANDS